MKVALGQINTTVGDLAGNEARILEVYRRGVSEGAELVVLPELATTGYPPRDLLLRREFVRGNLATLGRLATATGAVGLVLGHVGENADGAGRGATNSVSLLQGGRVVATRSKSLLPTYDVFDEDRYFEPAAENRPVEFNGRQLGLTICEDVWNDEGLVRERRYRKDPVAELVEAGADRLVNVSASPWHLGKNRVRDELLQRVARKASVPMVYCNLVGGNDELIFDGSSLLLDGSGRLLGRGASFREDFVVVDLAGQGMDTRPDEAADEEKVYRALVLGLGDYLRKCGIRSAVLGLSGGIDSAVTACLAAAALGPEHVRGVSLPSRYSSEGSLTDARELARKLGIGYEVVPIDPAFESVQGLLRKVFAGLPEDVTEENIQARLRGVILMALSNKFGSLLLTTGNKSEMAVGYCTLYGDMCGGLAVISDVPKTMVYRLARWINRQGEIIPESSIRKPPSAELRPDQRDQDSLPPYDELDAILEAYVVEGRSAEEIVEAGHEAGTVRRVLRMIDASEYKRRQAAPGLKVTSKAFGVGRRIPIAQRFG
jgi:NAD+ synthase (glutamine-hydrolysing)